MTLIQSDDESINVTIAVNVAQGKAVAVKAAQGLSGIGKITATIAQPHPVGLGIIGDESIQVAVAVKISQGNAHAI